MKKRRIKLLELLLLRFPGRERERHLSSVLCGDVYVSGELVRDPRRAVDPSALLEIKPKPFVSRGGEKLDGVLEKWKIDVRDRIVLDAGASTGGFTHCLLERGARRVYAVDVGRNQIHPRFRVDPRVVLYENTNIMEVELLDPAPSLAVCDLSFRSLRGAAKHILRLTTEGRLISLVKPQFEWRKPAEDFDGVVRSAEALSEILADLIGELRGEGLSLLRAAESPLHGRSGNREFFFLLTRETSDDTPDIGKLVAGLVGNVS
jgi:23S rRNA (cytidine1920-2'-O)/16S rRNA (cytidine1409-2'-O)-methyltransferase